MPTQVFKIVVLPAWELTFRELRPPISRHFQTLFLVGPRLSFGSLLDGPGVTLGGLWGSFGILWGALGALVRFFWVPLARLGCLLGSLWHLFATTGPQEGSSQFIFEYVVRFLDNVHIFV